MERCYLYNRKKSAYVTIDSLAHMSLTTDIQKAKSFTREAATNYINNQLRPERGNYAIIPYETDEKTAPKAVKLISPPLKENKWVNKAIDELCEQIQQYDLQMSDIYHFAFIHPNLPANKGYKLYRKLSDVAGARAKAKSQLRAIQKCIEAESEEEKTYKPRTSVYKELETGI